MTYSFMIINVETFHIKTNLKALFISNTQAEYKADLVSIVDSTAYYGQCLQIYRVLSFIPVIE